MRYILYLIAFYLLFSCSNPSSNNQTIHQKAYVIDTHTDTPMQMINKGLDVGIKNEAPGSRVDFPRLREGQVDAIFFAAFTSQKARTPENYDQAYQLSNDMIDSTLAAIDRYPEMASLALRSSDVKKISKTKKTAIFLGMENGFPIAKDIRRVEEFYKKGIRYITLSHSSNNDICDSSTDKKGAEHNGLSKFGEEVVSEMNRLGMLIDVSHISDKAFFDVIEKTKTPVIASHSSVRSVCNHPRNMNDEMLKALAKNGGVMQLCILGAYIREADTTSMNYIKKEELRKKYNNWQYKNDDERKAAWDEYDRINREFPAKLPTIAEAVDHIDYVKNLIGIDYIGIGSDFDGGGGLDDCVDVSDFPKITDELIKRGYSEEEIYKIWGGNFIRVFEAVEQLADEN